MIQNFQNILKHSNYLLFVISNIAIMFLLIFLLIVLFVYYDDSGVSIGVDADTVLVEPAIMIIIAMATIIVQQAQCLLPQF